MPRDWNRYYSNAVKLDDSPAALLVDVAERLTPGRALDLACGHGRNAIYLAKLGWRVTAVDASPRAIQLLRERSSGLDLETRVCDLEKGEFRIAPASFDLICDFLYLQRDLFPQIRSGVTPGGVFVGTLLLSGDGTESGPEPSPSVRPGELRDEFAGWKILYYSEGVERGRSRPEARIVARHA